MTSPSPASHDVDPVARRALTINLDERLYGTFAEIGAGQEVARWFFNVGGAAGTVAKTMSAYDMTFSDAIYGKASRYVSRERLDEMLDHEYRLLEERLGPGRGDRTCFFAFADTAAARSHHGGNECHAWLGVRFQASPRTPPNDFVVHARLLDGTSQRQQEAVGRLGVNLCTSAFYHHRDPSRMVETLLDDVGRDRLEIDHCELRGPSFARIDNRLLSLHLVRHGFTPAVLFAVDGRPVLASEGIRRKAVLVERGRFAPVTRMNLEMLESARTLFEDDSTRRAGPSETCPAILEVMEITMNNLRDGVAVAEADFLERVDLIAAAGRCVLVSDLGPFHRLAEYFAERAVDHTGIVLGIPLLRELFSERHYQDLDGGILEAFGRLFTQSVRLYVQPTRDPIDGRIVTVDSLHVAPHLRHLYRHLLENGFLRPLPCDEARLRTYSSEEVRSRIASGDPSWKELVDPAVAEVIERRRYFTGR